MRNRNIALPIDGFDLDTLQTDADFERAAERLLPAAVERISKSAAQAAGKDSRKGIKALKKFGATIGGRPLTRQRLARVVAKEATHNLSRSGKAEIKAAIVAQLKAAKASS